MAVVVLTGERDEVPKDEGVRSNDEEFLEMLRKFLIPLAIAVVTSLGGWVWNISADVAQHGVRVERTEKSVESIPQLTTDVAVIRRDVDHVRQEIDGLKQGQNALLGEVRGLRREGREQ